MEQSKSWLQSKTFWFGLAQTVFGVIALATGWVESQTATALIITGLSTFGFRATTSTPVSGFLPK